MCYRLYGWRHLVKATEVTAGQAESNGSLPHGGWLKVTCGLTACTQGSALGPPLGNEYGENYTFFSAEHVSVFVDCRTGASVDLRLVGEDAAHDETRLVGRSAGARCGRDDRRRR